MPNSFYGNTVTNDKDSGDSRFESYLSWVIRHCFSQYHASGQAKVSTRAHAHTRWQYSILP